MRQVATAFVAIAWLTICAASSAQAQGAIAIGFVNKTGTPVAVTAYSVVNGRPTPRTNLVVHKNGAPAFETAVPANAIRYYTIHDATQPNRILLTVPVPVQMRSLYFRIVPSPTDPKKVVLEPFNPSS